MSCQVKQNYLQHGDNTGGQNLSKLFSVNSVILPFNVKHQFRIFLIILKKDFVTKKMHALYYIVL